MIKDFLLIQNLDISELMESYRSFFASIYPPVFSLAALLEYFYQVDALALIRRSVISILILTAAPHFYHQSIDASMDAADSILNTQKQKNILMMNMFSMSQHRTKLESKQNFYKDKNLLSGTLDFIKYNLFSSAVNDIFTTSIFFLTKICFLILEVVYSIVYYLGYGLIGIPCLLYLFPGMSKVLMGFFTSFLWCLIVPHILVFILSLLSSEISRGYISGQTIGGSIMGTALLFVLALFVALVPVIGSMILSGSGVAAAGGIIAGIGSNWVLNKSGKVIFSAPNFLHRVAKRGIGNQIKSFTKGQRGGQKSAHTQYFRDGGF